MTRLTMTQKLELILSNPDAFLVIDRYRAFPMSIHADLDDAEIARDDGQSKRSNPIIVVPCASM